MFRRHLYLVATLVFLALATWAVIWRSGMRTGTAADLPILGVVIAILMYRTARRYGWGQAQRDDRGRSRDLPTLRLRGTGPRAGGRPTPARTPRAGKSSGSP